MTIIQKLDGTEYDLDQLKIRTKDFIVPSATMRNYTDYIEGRFGQIDLGSDFDARPIRCSFRFEAVDLQDYVLMRDEVFRLFRSDEPFYLIDKRNPSKRWKVKVNGSFEPQQRYTYGYFEVEFICHLGLAESLGRTLDPLTFEEELWQVGQGLIMEEDLKYTFSTNTFSVYNAGDVDVDPKKMYLIIKYVGASTNLKIENLTTGVSWQYTGTTDSSGNLEINGVRSLKNGLNIFSDTNRKLIELKPGWNNFQLTGANGSFEISFDFRFYMI